MRKSLEKENVMKNKNKEDFKNIFKMENLEEEKKEREKKHEIN